MSTAHAIAKASKARFLSQFPWTISPFIIGAPMRVMSGFHPALMRNINNNNKARTGCVQETQIEGAFIHRAGSGMAISSLLSMLCKSTGPVPHGSLHRAEDKKSLMSGHLRYEKPIRRYRSGYKLAPFKRVLKLPIVRIAQMR
uniref:Uncharacterized protein n=1 Tax=Fusarium oxysporum (strain Fo5176) TaxID=660025 RepID=A0A0D2Y242_FUSOF